MPWVIEYIGEEAGFGSVEERVFHWRFTHGGIRSIDVRFVVAEGGEPDLATDRARAAAELLAQESTLNRYRWWVSDDAITSVDGVRIDA